MTSVSNLGVPSGDEEGVPDHSYRKIGYGRRRQYVDCPTSARTTSVVDIAEVQTERYTTSNIESQVRNITFIGLKHKKDASLFLKNKLLEV